MKDLREKFINSAMTKNSIVHVLEVSECVPGTWSLCPPCGAYSNLKAVICDFRMKIFC